MTTSSKSLLLALGILGGLTAAAADSSWDIKGHARLRWEALDGTDLASSRNFFSMRVRPAFQFKAGENVLAVFEPQFARVLGETVSGSQASGATTDPAFNVHQAYAQWTAADALTIQGGRMVLSYGDQLVLGALEWNNTGRTFDAARLKIKGGWGTSDVFVSKLQENNATAGGTADYDFYGLYNTFDVGEAIKALDLYFFYLTDGTNPTSTSRNLWHLGARLKSNAGSFDYRLEGGFQNTTVAGGSSAYGVDGEFGWTFEESSKIRLSAGGLLASEYYSQLFPTVHAWLGGADVLGRQNVIAIVGRFSMKPADKWSLNFDFHKFLRAATTSAAYKTSGVALGTAGGSASTDLGMEFDLVANHDITETLSWQVGAAYMIPGQYLTDQFPAFKPFFAYTSAQVKF